MTSIAETSHPAASLARIAAVSRTVVLRVKELIRVHIHRRDADMLATFDDRMLADIGLTRGDLRDAFAEPLWRDPTVILRKRAGERRASRQRTILAPRVLSAPALVPEAGTGHDEPAATQAL